MQNQFMEGSAQERSVGKLLEGEAFIDKINADVFLHKVLSRKNNYDSNEISAPPHSQV